MVEGARAPLNDGVARGQPAAPVTETSRGQIVCVSRSGRAAGG